VGVKWEQALLEGVRWEQTLVRVSSSGEADAAKGVKWEQAPLEGVRWEQAAVGQTRRGVKWEQAPVGQTRQGVKWKQAPVGCQVGSCPLRVLSRSMSSKGVKSEHVQ